MSDESLFDRLKARGERVFTQVSTELMKNPQFVKAVQTAYQGKERLDAAAARALKTMNIPTREEFKKALRRIEALEGELEAVKSAQKKKAAPARSRKKA
ncbi:MAG TPA: hypothetical protein VFM88_03440 [Vicinamibacteria bacterium]|nr:hypothetical protein [Vicinamibacteria bacterium]